MAQPRSAICKSDFLLAKIHESLFSYWERVLMPSESNWDQQLTTCMGYCYGKYFSSFSYTNISDTEVCFFKLFLKHLVGFLSTIYPTDHVLFNENSGSLT